MLSIKRFTLRLAIFAIPVALLAPCHAQGGGVHPIADCNSGVAPVDVRVDSIGQTKCRAGIVPGFNAVVRPTPVCPQAIVVYPAHNKAVPLPGSGMRALQAGPIPVRTLIYTCESEWVWGFIPWGDRCVVDRALNTGVVMNHTLQQCPVIAND